MNGHRISQISVHWLDYHVWAAMLGRYHYQKYTPKLTNIAKLKAAWLAIWNDLPQEFIDKAILSFRKTSSVCCCSWQTLWTLSLNTQTFITEMFELLTKKLFKVWFIITDYSERVFYLLNHICYFNKKAQEMWTESSSVNLVKISYNSKDRIFPRGLVFLVHPLYPKTTRFVGPVHHANNGNVCNKYDKAEQPN